MVDFANILNTAQSGVPDYAANEAQKRLLNIQEQQAQMQQLQTALKVSEAQREQQRQSEFQAALDPVLMNPTAKGYSDLITRFPEYGENIKRGWDALDQGTQRADFQQLSEIYSAAANGKYDLAARALESRISADKDRDGQADPTDEAILEALRSGDPVQQKAAVGMIGIPLAAIAGPEHFGSVYGGLTKANERKTREIDGIVIDENDIDPATGQPRVIFESPYPRIIPGPNGAFYVQERGGPVGAAPSPTPTPSPAHPAMASVSTGSTLGPQIEQVALSVVPGMTADNVTSRSRSASKNKSVGGVEGSYHLTDNARDFVPPKGMKMGQLAARLKQALPGFDVINEGDHVHVEPGRGARSAGPVRVRSAQEYNKLPKGAQYLDPQGNLRTKS